jgi:N-carbamoyl-D-amino-acid hydrolase
MSRVIRIAAAQMGGTQRADARERTLGRMLDLLQRAAGEGATLVVFPELAFTTFFPRWLFDGSALDAYFERSMPNSAVQPVFDRARELGVGFYVGYAEMTREGRRFNSSVLVEPGGSTLGLYRKVHLPGTKKPRDNVDFQQLEKRYFEYGDLGFPAFRAGETWRRAIMGMMICNDRRWPEAWRVLGLQGVELVCLGYNSAAYDPNGGASENAALRTFHSQLVMQANAYMNATWAVAAAKAGDEDGSGLIGGSCIVDPNGRIVAEAASLSDELVVADCDLDMCRQGKDKMFNFAAHRRPEQYRAITSQVGVIEPAVSSSPRVIDMKTQDNSVEEPIINGAQS